MPLFVYLPHPVLLPQVSLTSFTHSTHFLPSLYPDLYASPPGSLPSLVQGGGGAGLGDPSMRSYAGETGQGPNSVGTSDRNSSKGLHLFPPCVTPSAEPTFLPGISGGSFLPGVEQKAGRKRTEGGQGIPTTQCCSPCSFPTHPHPLHQTRSLG